MTEEERTRNCWSEDCSLLQSHSTALILRDSVTPVSPAVKTHCLCLQWGNLLQAFLTIVDMSVCYQVFFLSMCTQVEEWRDWPWLPHMTLIRLLTIKCCFAPNSPPPVAVLGINHDNQFLYLILIACILTGVVNLLRKHLLTFLASMWNDTLGALPQNNTWQL